MIPYLGEDLILVLSPPRSGSTMLQRILGTHSAVQTHPEPHVLTPLAFQGVYYQVERAAYNHRVAAQALREFIDFLPHTEEDYLDACRAYCRELYGRARITSGKRYFLDKTPNYADTILPFVVRLLPKARYVVLVRHPVAQIASVANTFVNGDFQRALYQRDIPGTFIPAMARFMRDGRVPFVHLRYEDLVSEPETTVRRIFAHLDLEFEPACLQFGDAEHITKSFGDPNIQLHKRPVSDSVDRWVDDLLTRPDRELACRQVIDPISPDDLATIGYPRQTLWQPLERARATSGLRSRLTVRQLIPGLKWRLAATLGRLLARPVLLTVITRLRNRLDSLIAYGARWRGDHLP